MNEYYKDIIGKIKQEPQWFDERAVPRYCRFSPKRLANIYAEECALVLIECQMCRHKFEVAFSRSTMDKVRHRLIFGKDKKMPTIADSIQRKTLCYGDPPNIECCPAGTSMISDSIRVLQYWRRKRFNWVRDRKLEVDIMLDYAVD